MRATQWRRYFKTNGVRVWQELRFTGFRETPDIPKVYAQWIGTTNTGEFYFTSVTIDTGYGDWKMYGKEGRNNWMLARKRDGKLSIDTFLYPECRCRVGFHWKCSLHHTWSN